MRFLMGLKSVSGEASRLAFMGDRSQLTPSSTAEIPDSLVDILVRRPSVPHRAEDALVPGHSLSEPQVFGLPVDICQGRVTQTVKANSAFKTGSPLPLVEGLSKSSGRKASTKSTDEERCIRTDVLFPPSLPGKELHELPPQGLRQQNLLGLGSRVASLEDSKHHPPSRLACSIKDIAHVQGKKLVLPQCGPQGKAEKHMVPESATVLSRHLEQPTLFIVRQSLGGQYIRCVCHVSPRPWSPGARRMNPSNSDSINSIRPREVESEAKEATCSW